MTAQFWVDDAESSKVLPSALNERGAYTSRNRATDEQKRIGWEMAVRIEKIICTVLREAREW